MPSNAWKMITASVSAAIGGNDCVTLLSAPRAQRTAATTRISSPIAASTDAATCSPRMYSGMAIATSSDAPSTCATPWRSRRAASTASNSTSAPSEPASMRCTCSRHARVSSNGRIALAAWSAASAGADGHVAWP